MDRFTHARLLAAQVEVSVAAGELDPAREAARQLAAVEAALASPVISATAATAAGALRLAEGDPAAALERLRHALRLWRDLGLPYEEARARLLTGAALRMLGDEEGGRSSSRPHGPASNGSGPPPTPARPTRSSVVASPGAC